MGHGLKWRQAETLIQRREDENLGDVIENAERLDRNEAKKAHVVLHGTLDDSAPKIGVRGEVVTDDDQLEVREFAIFLQLALECGKCLDHAANVLVWANAPGVKQERIIDLVTLSDELLICFSGWANEKALVDGVVGYFDIVVVR